MHRSPGVFFDHDKGKTHSSGKYLFAARVIPYRGSWLDFEFDAKDLVYVRIDRRRKLPATTLLLALWNKDSRRQAEEGRARSPTRIAVSAACRRKKILAFFYKQVVVLEDQEGLDHAVRRRAHEGHQADGRSGRCEDRQGRRRDRHQDDAAPGQEAAGSAASRTCWCTPEEIIGRFSALDVVNEETGEILIEAGDEISQATLTTLEETGAKELATLNIDHVNVGPYIRNTLKADKNSSREEALIDIYRVMRPGEPPTLDTAEALFRGLFFDLERYDLSSVGRVKMNSRLSVLPNEHFDPQRRRRPGARAAQGRHPRHPLGHA